MPALRIYSRPGCHLCELLIEKLLPMIRGQLNLEVVNIDDRPEWLAEFGTRIPVVEFAGQFVCQYTLDEAEIHRILAELTAS
jgi:thioredoxin-like negative regulator of GroEL